MASSLSKRALAVIGREWMVEPGGDKRADRKAAEAAESWLRSVAFDRWCRQLLAPALLQGYAVSEAMWGIRDGLVVPVDLLDRRPRRFVFDDQRRLRMLTWSDMWRGVELPERKFVVHRHGGAGGDPYGEGLGRQLFWPAFFKRQNIAFWLAAAERFGTPTVKGIAPQGTLEEDVAVLLEKLQGLAREGVIALPSGYDVQLLESARAGGLSHAELCRYMDEEIQVAILGQTLTTTVGSSGSRALGDVHKEVQDELVDADADMLSETLNATLLTWFAEINFPGAAPPRVWRPRPESELERAKVETATFEARFKAIEYVEKMRAAGYQPEDPEADFADQAKGRWLFVGKASSPPPPAEFAAPAEAPERDAVDDLVDQLDELAAPAIAEMVEGVRQAIADSDTLEQAIERLATLFPGRPPGALEELMARSLMAAHLQGAADA